MDALFIISCAPASGYLFESTFWSLSNISYSDECQMKKAFSMCKKCCCFSHAVVNLTMHRSPVFHFIPSFPSTSNSFPVLDMVDITQLTYPITVCKLHNQFEKFSIMHFSRKFKKLFSLAKYHLERVPK